MGLLCDISLIKPPSGVYTPGSTVTGKIKYRVDEDTMFSKITISLKGRGRIAVDDKFRKGNDVFHSYRNCEDYVDIDNVIHDNKKGVAVPEGTYESEFNFKLPTTIPASIRYYKDGPALTVWRNIRFYIRIKYYIRIKFEKPGLMTFNKHFKRKITVVPEPPPQVSMDPVVFTKEKVLMQLVNFFSNYKNLVCIKATVSNPFVQPGERVKLNYEVENNTNLALSAILIKLVEVNTFCPEDDYEVKTKEDVQETDRKYGAMKNRELKKFVDEIAIPETLATVANSKIFSREYVVSITAVLPMPHRNVVLEIPIKVAAKIKIPEGPDAPPPYCEAMPGEKSEKLELTALDSTDDDEQSTNSVVRTIPAIPAIPAFA